MADEAGVGDALARARLRPFVQENNSCAVDYVGLNSGYVDVIFLNLGDSNDVMVR